MKLFCLYSAWCDVFDWGNLYFSIVYITALLMLANGECDVVVVLFKSKKLKIKPKSLMLYVRMFPKVKIMFMKEKK